MIVLTKAEQAAVKWLGSRGVRVAEPTTLPTHRLSVRAGRRSPDAFVAVFVLNAVFFAGLLGAVATHVTGWFVQRHRLPPLPADGHYGEVR